MGSEAAQSCPLTGSSDDLAQAVGSESAERSGCAKEQLALGSFWTGVTQVGHDRPSYIRWKRQPLLGTSLPSDDDLSGAPVNVVQSEAGDFGGPQPETDQRHQDRVIAPPGRLTLVAARQQCRHLPRCETTRQGCAAPSCRRWHCTCQRLGDYALNKCEAQESPQPRREPLHSPRADGLACTRHEPGDVTGDQLVESAVGVLIQERQRDAHVLDDRVLCQTALSQQVAPESIDQLVGVILGWRRGS